MAFRIPEEVIEEIKNRVSIVEVVGEYLPLTKEGANYKSLCPFHKEKTPSFKVHEAKGIFRCFGCGESGNIFSFLMKMEGLSFLEALERLARRAGVQLPGPNDGQDGKERLKETRLFEVNLMAMEFFRDCLNNQEIGKPCRDYLLERGFSPNWWQKFSLGFAPDSWDMLYNFLRSKGIPEAIMLEAGLVLPRQQGGYYDRFRNRLIFGIRDRLERVRGFGARVLDNTLPKYINSPETSVYKKGEGFYGLNLAIDAIRKRNRAIIVEGYFDQLSLYRCGIEECVATLGTALTSSQVNLISRYTRNIYLVFDPDPAGEKASYRALELFLSEGIIPYCVFLPTGTDPDLFIRGKTKEDFESLLENAPRMLDFFIEQELKSAGLDVAKRADAIRSILRLFSFLPGGLEQELYLKKLSERVGVGEKELHSILFKVRIEKDRYRDGEERVATQENELSAGEKTLLMVLLHFPFSYVATAIEESDVIDEFDDEKLKEFVSLILSSAISKERINPGDYLHNLVGTKWERVIGKLLLEEPGFREEDLARVLKDAFLSFKVKRVKRRASEVQEKIVRAKDSGNQELLDALLKEKFNLQQELMRLKEARV